VTAVLSPAEQVEVTRFGVHDEDVIADMEEHRDDDVKCAVIHPPCDDTATHMLVCTWCGGQVCPTCAVHAQSALMSWRLVRHEACGHIAAMRDMVRAVML
jgi:hypothetical protein